MAEYTTVFESGIPVVKYMGSFTSIISAPMPGIKELVLSGYKKIVFDASGVNHINSQGLSSIINTHRYCHKQNVHMVVAAAKPNVMKVIRIARANLFIPFYDDVKTALKEVQYSAGPSLRSKSREQIVVVQKNIALKSDLESILHEAHQMQNYDLITQTNLHDALEYLKNNEVHLVIVEVNFEIKDVEAFIGSMIMDPKLSIIPVLVATPQACFNKAFEFILNGVDDFLPHPFDEYESSTRIRNLLELYYIAKAAPDSSRLSGLKLSRSTKSESGHMGGIRGG